MSTHPKRGAAGLDKSWIGVDLDGTLAEYHGWSPNIGRPIWPMVDRVRAWLESGETVKILTARGTAGDADQQAAQHAKIRAWCYVYLGQELEVTDRKDIHMKALYDDRAVGVEFNTGRLLSPELGER